MSKQQQQIDLLNRALDFARQGKEIPADWAKVIFPSEKREYELSYHGKQTAEAILANVDPVPLQEVSNFNTPADYEGWQNKLIFGDNLQVLKRLIEDKKNGKLKNADGTDGVRLVYIDPPFSTRKDFKVSGEDQKAYQDKVAGAEFLEWLRRRLILLKEVMADDGSIYVHLDYRKGHYVKVLLDEIFGEKNLRNEIIWCYTGPGSPGMKQFNRKHDVIYWYSKSDKWHFNSTDVRVPYKDENQSLRKAFASDGSWSDEDIAKMRERGRIPDDWWEFSVAARKRVDGIERTAYPTEKPNYQDRKSVV